MTELATLSWRPFWVPSIHFCLNTIPGPHNVGKGGVGATGFYKVKTGAAIKHLQCTRKPPFPVKNYLALNINVAEVEKH